MDVDTRCTFICKSDLSFTLNRTFTRLQACDITTVLRSMTVTPLSPPDTVRCHQTTVDKPPYAVVGMTSQPFLAKIELVFNGVNSRDLSDEGQPFSMEHWVDVRVVYFFCLSRSHTLQRQLDPLRCSAAVVGEEQICDIELDKRTVIRPRVSGQQAINFKALWALAADGTPSDKREANVKGTGPPSYGISVVILFSELLSHFLHIAYEGILRDLLPQFPLTLQGAPSQLHQGL